MTTLHLLLLTFIAVGRAQFIAVLVGDALLPQSLAVVVGCEPRGAGDGHDEQDERQTAADQSHHLRKGKGEKCTVSILLQ